MDYIAKQLDARISEINKALEQANAQVQQAMANLNLIIGAKQECENFKFLLSQPVVEPDAMFARKKNYNAQRVDENEDMVS